MISPSELPDSPTQTVPPSPRNIKPPVVLNNSANIDTDNIDHPSHNVQPSVVLQHPPLSGKVYFSVWSSFINIFQK